MTRQKREAEAKIQIIRVHLYAGSYIANGGGKRATCTAGAVEAAHALAYKLFGNLKFTITALSEANTWRATVIQEAV